MQSKTSIYWAKCVLGVTAIPLAIYAYASGPLPRNTGAPGDQNCSSCHLGTQVNSSNGAVQIAYSGGTSYTPGERGKFTVTITDTSGRQRYGFQASARLVSNLNNGQAGTLIPGAGTLVQCEDGSETLPCRAAAPVQFINHSAASTRNTFEFEWTAPAAGSGDVRVFVAGNAANGNGTDSGDRIYTSSITLTPAATSGGPRPAITSGRIVNAWSASRTIATNTWIEIHGSDLASETRDWSGAAEFGQGKLPLSLGGVSVTIGGKPAPVFYISPQQVNALVPDDTNLGNLPVVVKTANGESVPETVVREAVSPSLLTVVGEDGKRRVVGRLNSNPNIVLGLPAGSSTRPFAPGDVVQFYATGLGPTNPPVAADTIVSGAPALVNAPRITINNVPVNVLGSALVGSGLYQINGIVPDVPNGEHTAVVEVGGVSSPTSIVISVQR